MSDYKFATIELPADVKSTPLIIDRTFTASITFKREEWDALKEQIARLPHADGTISIGTRHGTIVVPDNKYWRRRFRFIGRQWRKYLASL